MKKAPFFYVGEIFTRRHVPEMLSAFERFVRDTDDSSTAFLVRGSNQTIPRVNLSEMIRQINNRLGRQAIVWLPRVSDSRLVDLYKNAAGVFYLSSYEGFGFPVIESLACGTPVVTCQGSSLSEIAQNYANFFYP